MYKYDGAWTGKTARRFPSWRCRPPAKPGPHEPFSATVEATVSS